MPCERGPLAQVRVDAVATVVNYLLDTSLSPHVQRVVRATLSRKNRKQYLPRLALEWHWP